MYVCEHIWLWALLVCCVCGWVEKLLAFEKPAATCRIFICTCIYTRKFSTWSSPKSPENRAYLRRQAYRAAGSQQHCFNKYKVMDIHTHTHTHTCIGDSQCTVGKSKDGLNLLTTLNWFLCPAKGIRERVSDKVRFVGTNRAKSLRPVYSYAIQVFLLFQCILKCLKPVAKIVLHLSKSGNKSRLESLICCHFRFNMQANTHTQTDISNFCLMAIVFFIKLLRAFGA